MLQFKLISLVPVVLLFGVSYGRANALTIEDPGCNLTPACALEARAARVAFETKEYEESLRRYLRAFRLVPDPRLLVNIGRNHFRLGQHQAALDYYSRASALVHDPEIIPQVNTYVAEARAPVELARKQLDMALQTEASLTPPRDKSRLRLPVWRGVLGFVSLGAGLALCGLGSAGLVLDGRSDASSGKVYQTLLPAAVMTGGGAALAIGGGLALAIPGSLHSQEAR